MGFVLPTWKLHPLKLLQAQTSICCFCCFTTTRSWNLRKFTLLPVPLFDMVGWASHFQNKSSVQWMYHNSTRNVPPWFVLNFIQEYTFVSNAKPDCETLQNIWAKMFCNLWMLPASGFQINTLQKGSQKSEKK